jgi:hypothetical protein
MVAQKSVLGWVVSVIIYFTLMRGLITA